MLRRLYGFFVIGVATIPWVALAFAKWTDAFGTDSNRLLYFAIASSILALFMGPELLGRFDHRNTLGKLQSTIHADSDLSSKIMMRLTKKGVMLRFKNILPFEVVCPSQRKPLLRLGNVAYPKLVTPAELDSPERRALMMGWLLGAKKSQSTSYQFETNRWGVHLVRTVEHEDDLSTWDRAAIVDIFPMLERRETYFGLEVLATCCSANETESSRSFAETILREHFEDLCPLIDVPNLLAAFSKTQLLDILSDSWAEFSRRTAVFVELLRRGEPLELKPLFKIMSEREIFSLFAHAYNANQGISADAFVPFLNSGDDELVKMAAKALGRIGDGDILRVLRKAQDKHLPLSENIKAIEAAIESVQVRIDGGTRGSLALIEEEEDPDEHGRLSFDRAGAGRITLAKQK
jgi:hypothetical protein